MLCGVGDRHLDGDDQSHRVGSVLQGDLARRVRDGAGNDTDNNNYNDDDDHNNDNVVDDEQHDGAVDDEQHDDDQHYAVIDPSTLAPSGVEGL